MGAPRLDIQTQTALEHLLGDLRLYHDKTQLRCFVLSAEGHGTVWGIYRQCLRELDSRRTTLQGRRRDFAKAEIELKHSQSCARRWAWTAKGRRARDLAAVEVDMYRQAVGDLAFQISETTRELHLFIEVGQSCKEVLGTINDERRDELDQQFWETKFARQAELSLATTGKIDGGIVNLAIQLPEASFRRLMPHLGNIELIKGLDRLRAGAMVVEDNGNGLTKRVVSWEPVGLEAVGGS